MSRAGRRIVVVGTSCSGKTTFARRLARVYAIPHVELDALYWRPNWVSQTPDAFRSLVDQATAGESWAVDGNYSAIRDLVWSRATTVIWLDYALPRVLCQAVTRTLRRAPTREVLYAENRESLRAAFLSRDSILWWVVSTFHRRRRRYRALFEAPALPHLRMVRLRKPTEAEELLRHGELTRE